MTWYKIGWWMCWWMTWYIAWSITRYRGTSLGTSVGTSVGTSLGTSLGSSLGTSLGTSVTIDFRNVYIFLMSVSDTNVINCTQFLHALYKINENENIPFPLLYEIVRI